MGSSTSNSEITNKVFKMLQTFSLISKLHMHQWPLTTSPSIHSCGKRKMPFEPTIIHKKVTNFNTPPPPHPPEAVGAVHAFMSSFVSLLKFNG